MIPDSFSYAASDPFAGEHRGVAQWVEDVAAAKSYTTPDLKNLASGQTLIAGDAACRLRYVRAALEQSRFWERKLAELKDLFRTPNDPEWEYVCRRANAAAAVIGRLTRQALPFAREDVRELVTWANETRLLSPYRHPVGSVAKVLERYLARTSADAELQRELTRLAERLRASDCNDLRKFAGPVLRLSSAHAHIQAPAPTATASIGPAPAGTPGVLEPIKRWLGMTTVSAPPFPFRAENALFDAIHTEADSRGEYGGLERLEAGRRLADESPETLGRLALVALQRLLPDLLPRRRPDKSAWSVTWVCHRLLNKLQTRSMKLTRDGAFDYLLARGLTPAMETGAGAEETLSTLLAQVEYAANEKPFTPGERYVLMVLRAAHRQATPPGTKSERLELLNRLIGDGGWYFLAPGEVWSDAANHMLARADAAARGNWVALLNHALTASLSPNADWSAEAIRLAEMIGTNRVADRLRDWFTLAVRGRSLKALRKYSLENIDSGLDFENGSVLRGLLWIAAALPERETFRSSISDLAIVARTKKSGLGRQAPKIARAAELALDEIEASSPVK